MRKRVYSRLLAGKQFNYAGSTYPYFVHPYNRTGRNERAIEIPIVSREFVRHAPDQVLEVGNVLAHYFPATHLAVDKYEQANIERVRNVDIVDFAPGRQFELIVSISTLEQVGWDETPRDPDKVLKALHRLRQLLAPTGSGLVTFPAGHNEGLDRVVRDGTFEFATLMGMRRQNRANEWRQVSIEETLRCQIGTPYPWSNGVFIGTFTAA